MTLIRWNPDPAPFGNAGGLDTVAPDVAETIARSFGATVTRGSLPPDMTASYSDEEPGSDPAPLVTIGRGGVTVYMSGRRSISGYTSHDWRKNLAPDTLVIDTRTVDEDSIARYAVRGPMVDPDLEPGTVSTLGPVDPILANVADEWMAPFGGLAATGATVR